MSEGESHPNQREAKLLKIILAEYLSLIYIITRKTTFTEAQLTIRDRPNGSTNKAKRDVVSE